MIASWRDWQTRLVADPGFRRRIARIWPFSLIARRQARRLFDIAAGFVYSQTFMTCVRLGWFEQLADGPRPLTGLAADAGLTPAAARRLVAAAESLELLAWRQDDAVALGTLGAAMLGDTGIAAMASHHPLLYADLADPVALLRGEAASTALGDYWGYAREQPGSLGAARVAEYSRLMAASQPMVADQVLAAYPFERHRTVLDVGGGTGAFLRAVGAHHPRLKRLLFDLPGVIELAAQQAADGIERFPGNFRVDALPDGADLITLVRIVHDHDDDVVDELLTNIRQKLPTSGVLMIAEPLADTPGARAMGAAYFGFYLLAMGSGRARSHSEINGILRRNGFESTRRWATPVPLICSVLTTRKV